MYGQLRVGERQLRKTLNKVMKEGSKTANVIEKCKKESKLDKNLDELLMEMQSRLQEYEESLFVRISHLFYCLLANEFRMSLRFARRIILKQSYLWRRIRAFAH